MNYKFADNDHLYESYQQKIMDVLRSKDFDFLSPKNNIGVFDVSCEFGHQYCRQLEVEFPAEMRLFREGYYREELNKCVDLGKPLVFFSKEFGSHMNGTMARYIYHAMLISKYIHEKFGSNEIDVIEIGGGYGGLCFWLKNLVKTIVSYTIIDLPVVCLLQKTCLQQLGGQCNSISDPTVFKKSSRPLFLISNYGYSEFSEYYQNLYKKTVINQADAGFMIWNNWTGLYPFTELPMTIQDETPVFQNCFNKFIYF